MAPVSRLDIASAVLLVVSSIRLTGPLPWTSEVTSTDVQAFDETGPDAPVVAAL